ncbi:MAG: aldo/keto reductase family oxidoreductase [Clostridiales bacterium]|nr:aldo/keto reductase family oxidoreductase [Clostridiales bacterium]
MKQIKIGGLFEASEIALGSWRIAGLEADEAERLLATAVEAGINLFDNADIYGGGAAEEVFGAAVKALGIREKILVQTKCGIRSGYYDFSKEHILNSVDGSLKRLGMDHIDVLLLHRPDTLMEPEEVAEAFDVLHEAGKVRYFGVSNQNPRQMELLQSFIGHKLVTNQLQLSLTNSSMIDTGFNVNMEINPALDRDGGVLEYCRLKGITIQAWSPLQYGVFEGTFIDNEEMFASFNAKLQEFADLKGVEKTAIAFAWILRHPAKIQAIAGTTNPERLSELCKGADVDLNREEWYELYRAAGNKLP